MISTQNLRFAFGGVWHGWVDRSVSAARLAMIFLPTRLRLAIFDNVFTLTFCTAIYNYLGYHAFMIPPVKVLPPPTFVFLDAKSATAVFPKLSYFTHSEYNRRKQINHRADNAANDKLPP